MPLRYLFDEHLRGSPAKALQLYSRKCGLPVDVIAVGDVGGPASGTDDPALLLWAERYGRIIVSRDKNTLRTHFASHLSQGNESPGVFLAQEVSLFEILEFLTIAAYASDPREWHNRVLFVPAW